MSDPKLVAPITIGIDLGTSSIKVVALKNGAPVGEAFAPFPTLSELPHQAEQEPQDWLHSTARAMHALNSELSLVQGPRWTEQVAAIGLTGQLPTLVCLSDHGPIAPAITWRDGRADAWGTQKVGSRKAMYAATGMPIDARYLAPMFEFHFAKRRNEVRCILSAKDYLLSCLTGLEITEPSTAAGFGVYDLHTGTFSEQLCKFWDLPTVLLPSIRPANSLAGPLNANGAKLLGLPTNIPVSTGAADSVSAAYALAGLDEHIVSISFGSSTVIVGACPEIKLDSSARYLVTPHVTDRWYGREMDLLATGTGYQWLSKLFGWNDHQIDSHAAQSVPGAKGLVFPPYLAGGEQGALWNPKLTGALFGLTLHHTHSDIARAYMEGVFFEIRRCIEVLAESGKIDLIKATGNLTAYPSSLQMLADILQRPVSASTNRSPAAIGAALLAHTLIAHSTASTHAPAAASAGSSASIEPNPASADLYAKLYQRYLERSALCEY